MKKPSKRIAVGRITLLIFIFGAVGASALHAGQVHFQAGLSYTQGAYDVMDKLDNNFDLKEKFVWPVGLTLSPYYEWDCGFAAGITVGPAAVISIDEGSDDNYSFILPVGGDVRYTFLRDRDVAPYLRAGVRFPIVGGDYLDSGEVGAFGAIGVEFWRQKKVQAVLEVGYDSSTVKVAAGPLGGGRRAAYAGFMAGIGVKFRF